MKRTSRNTLLYTAALMMSVALASCEKTGVEPEQPADAPTYEPQFSISTRTDASGDPTHGDPYTIISYNVGGTTSNDAYKYQVSAAAQWGFYAYDDGVLSGRPAGTLVPVAMVASPTNTAAYTTPPTYWPTGWTSGGALVESSINAQHLPGVPVAGLNPVNNQGIYRVAMIHPALPMRYSGTGNLGYLAVYALNEDVYASMPDDADGDPTTDDPFEITVTSNGQIHQLPVRTELYPLKSAVKCWFYSEYYDESDTGQTLPKTQTFVVDSLRLYNIGSNGWYSARTGIVYPNYNYSTTYRQTLSSTDDQTGGTYLPNHIDLKEEGKVIADNVTPGPGKAGIPIQWTAETPVFPSDYRGADAGGLVEVIPLTLSVALKVGGADNKASIPIALKMEHNKRYNFYINVTSEVLVITYSVSPWDAVDGGTDDNMGGEQYPYATIPLSYNPGGWGNGGGGDDEIGG